MNQRADASERRFWKFFSPGFLQAFAIARGDGEKKLVVFTVGNCVVDLGAGRERKFFFIDLESEFARLCETREIGAETVAQIHHRVNTKISCQPARFFDARDKSEMFAAQRSTEPAADKKIVAFFPTGARN